MLYMLISSLWLFYKCNWHHALRCVRFGAVLAVCAPDADLISCMILPLLHDLALSGLVFSLASLLHDVFPMHKPTLLPG